MLKRALPFLLLMLLLPLGALAEEMRFTVSPDVLRPGKTERISFYVPASGTARLELYDENGNFYALIRESMDVAEGINHLSWDGQDEKDQPVPPGAYWLSLTVGDQQIREVLEIGEESPQILAVNADNTITAHDDWILQVSVNEPGTLTVRVKMPDNEWYTVVEESVSAGENTIRWDGLVNGLRLPLGPYAVQLRLTDHTGYSGTAKQVNLTVVELITPTPIPTATPAPTPHAIVPSAVTTQEEETNYWTLPMGEMDEAAIWDIMMQPMTVIDGNQKEVYRLRKTPDNSMKKENVVGEITYASQGVHVLETRSDGWTLVEAYNSSYGPDCKSRRGFGVTDDLIQGYVKTSLLKTVTPRTDYALLVDKLTQKMYIFSQGKIIGELLVSTGLNNAIQSWNETPAGEFVMISKIGGFAAGNLWCAYGMRINGGCAIHQVPYIGTADTPSSRQDYSSTVRVLGQKASHGCIRVQKSLNDQGQNMKWLWDNIKINTKVLIWDDTGRFLEYPADDTPLYYNPSGGKYYHDNQNCTSVKSRYLPLTAFTYKELDTGDFTALTACPTCGHTLRKSEIDAINRENGY